MSNENITNGVLVLRTKQKITQEELGAMLGVTRQTIIAIEKGTYLPSLPLALKIAKLFKKKVEEIFVLEEN